ncbi:hypothetical protein [Anaplasma phagocytophilum]|uniref:hypothetical protein n=1 Tax=Anaplasma phagocytophilum TaxID=948 RepID=UPI0007DF544E|nr:hypothetical protein [Anaplasma phagocytophilum]SBO31564.1 hypothetical protein ANAPC3_00573 [Anaplasma phagocytophilum]SBO31595.1 hypothetical protein ANAPC2_00716 [Anaplasma phagocytophilum]SBO32243.1 hypothetical protein ANAPC4_00743 [Anaplasma phagocytophilum]
MKWFKENNWFNSKKRNIKLLWKEGIDGRVVADALTKACIVAAVIMSVVVAIQFITAGSMDFILRNIAILACLVVMVNMSIKWQSYTHEISRKQQQEELLDLVNSYSQDIIYVMKAQEASRQQIIDELLNISEAVAETPVRLFQIAEILGCDSRMTKEERDEERRRMEGGSNAASNDNKGEGAGGPLLPLVNGDQESPLPLLNNDGRSLSVEGGVASGISA